MDRRIAVEVMGEEEPARPPNGFLPAPARLTENWLWAYPQMEWRPAPFSSNLDHAMRAWGHYCSVWKQRHRDHPLELVIKHEAGWEEPFAAHTGYFMYPTRLGQTLPEAICNLLLALGEDRR